MSLLPELQEVIDREIPVCRVMGMRLATTCDEQLADDGLRVAMPLEINRNHQGTAFAGSLNALCTLAGWAMTWLQLRRLHDAGIGVPSVEPGAIVIRRSKIQYNSPVVSDEVLARCLPPDRPTREHFAGMLTAKGQTKLGLTVEIGGPTPERPAVLLEGTYVVLPPEE